MLEFDMEAFKWFFVGVGVTSVTFIIFMLLGYCMVSGRWSRLEEQYEDRLKVKNWKATPDRLTMTKRGNSHDLQGKEDPPAHGLDERQHRRNENPI